MKNIIILVLGILLFGQSAQSQIFRTQAETAILIDVGTDTVLYEKEADMRFAPSSLTKLMTVYIAFEELQNNNIALDDSVYMSKEQWLKWRGKGSTMYIGERDKVTVEDLLRGIIVLSGNDASVALAELISSSHENFVLEMNAKAKQLGMMNSNFTNANGWPDDNMYTTARDISILSKKLVTNFPEYYPMFAETQFLYKNYTGNQYNRNPVLSGRYAIPGADGLKTGGNPSAGEYGLAASVNRDGQHMIAVLGKLPSRQARASDVQSLFQLAFRQFKNYNLFTKGEKVHAAEVWLGKELTVPMVIDQDISLTISRLQRRGMDVSVTFSNPIAAPIKKGQVIGKLTIKVPERKDLIYDLKAGTDIDNVGGFGKISAALDYLIYGSAGAGSSN